MSDGWVGVDLDGTLAVFPHNFPEIGPPIEKMVERVRAMLDEGQDVRIFTARVAVTELRSEHGISDADFVVDQLTKIERWCLEYLGQVLPVTAQKDFKMIALFDDRCVQMITNTGESLGERVNAIAAGLRGVLDLQ